MEGCSFFMRVITGKYRSRPLHSLPGTDLRPTADKLRQALFNILTPGDPDALSGTAWLDLYAGTGAVGIEALSRGAQHVYFVESSADAVELIKKNLESLGIKNGFRIMKQNSLRALKTLEAAEIQVDFVFIDPPYRMEADCKNVVSALGESALLKAGSVVLAEHFKKFDPGDKFGELRRYRTLVQGDAVLSFYRRSTAIT
jgi:16S rRNA (guanine966-N2)-methyltransferase